LNYGNIREAADAASRTRFVCRSRLGAVPQNWMGKWRDRAEALHVGNRTRTAKAFATNGTTSLWWITDHLRPIGILKLMFSPVLAFPFVAL